MLDTVHPEVYRAPWHNTDTQGGPQVDKNGFWYRLVHLDPALFRGLVVAVVALLASIGILVSPDLADSLVGAVVALSAIVQALWTKPAVTPNDKVVVYVPDPVSQPGQVAPGNAVTSATNSEIVEAARTAPADDINY